MTFIDTRSERFYDRLQRRRLELTQATPDQPVDDEALYLNVAGYARFAVEMFVKVSSAWRPVLEDPSNLQIFFDYYAIAKPLISKEIYVVSITIRIVLGFVLLALIWKYDFPHFMVLIIAILNDGIVTGIWAINGTNSHSIEEPATY
ncbi:hypothetical protein Syun_012669 [Stephania yunnanensis]|uniref:Uncharacterized protein n=1 Tax=Stephania yunnanensis TaxID=152371 RepID=A0AAP0K0L7_9MAGN